MSTVTGEQGTDDMVRVEFTVSTRSQVFLTQDEWEAYENGGQLAADRVADLLQVARDELLQDGSLELELVQAILVEADGYLGTDITTLKKF